MKQIIYFTLAFIAIQILFSCSVSKELREERREWDYKNWEQKYKDRAFCLCQLKGYENKNIEAILIKNDKSYYNPLAIAIFDNSLEAQVLQEIKKIRQDSINSIGTHPSDLKKLLQKRAVTKHCLEFYSSKRLDHLAKAQKKHWSKISNIMNEIHSKTPTY